MDEKVIHVRDELWYDLNAVDGKTKYVLAHRFVDERTLANCVALLRQIKKTCGHQILEKYKRERHKPKKERHIITFVSDKFTNYRTAWSKIFYKTTKLVFGIPIGCKRLGLEHNNNPIERYNQDIKDQIKNKRHFGSGGGACAFLDLRRIIKNFINPHQQLKERTPAEAAGINLHLGRQRLLTLIKYVRRQRITTR